MKKAPLQIDARVRRLPHYIEDLENGRLQIPAFQRDFVWTNADKLALFDSLRKGYPIGSILLWKPHPDSAYEVTKQIGPYEVPSKGDSFFYILDGFQRLSTMLGCLINPSKTAMTCHEEKRRKDFFIYYDLIDEEFSVARTSELQSYQVPIYELIDARTSYRLERKLRESGIKEQDANLYMERFVELGSKFIDYQLPSIDIIGGDIEEVVEIFSRVNSKGADISPDWMVSALTYNNHDGFRLGTEIDLLIEKLKVYNFQGIKRELILQCIIHSFGKAYFDQTIEELIKEHKGKFIPQARRMMGHIEQAVKFLYEELLVIDSKLLPYGTQLVFITDFFANIQEPSGEQLEKLKRWFWITTYSNYFTIYSLSKQRRAYNRFQDFLKSSSVDPIYNDRPGEPFSTADFPQKIYFGSVRAKALVLFMLHHASQGQLPIQAAETNGLYLNFLFSDLKDAKGNFYPESAVAAVDTLASPFPKSSDASFMLDDVEQYEHLLLTPTMQASREHREEVLRQRKLLIIQAESEFVQSFGIKYTEGAVTV
jgi:hypothetical protein